MFACALYPGYGFYLNTYLKALKAQILKRTTLSELYPERRYVYVLLLNMFTKKKEQILYKPICILDSIRSIILSPTTRSFNKHKSRCVYLFFFSYKILL